MAAFQDGITQYNILLGDANKAIASLAPSATSGIPLISQGSSANPAFGTVAIAGGGTNLTSYTTGDLLYCSSSNVLSKLAIGSATNVLTVVGGVPAWGAAPSGGGITWNNVTGTSQAMAVNNAYIANNGSLVTMTLPSTASVGQVVQVQGSGAGGWRIAQNSGQTIRYGDKATTTGTGGRLDSFNRYDGITLVCIVANTDWASFGAQGNITYT